jgi:hypothetical protein
MTTSVTITLNEEQWALLEDAARLHNVVPTTMAQMAVEAWIRPTGDVEAAYVRTNEMSQMQVGRVLGFLFGRAEAVPPLANALVDSVDYATGRRGVWT